MKRFEHLLRDAIGLDIAAVGSTSICRAVRLRMKALGLAKLDDYHRRLILSRAELDELIEAVVVTETWFLREEEVFAALVRLVKTEERLPAHANARLRLLSFPCASGEEPYSMAIALSDAGVHLDRFHIDGVDISAGALARAKNGVYGRNSFRGTQRGFRDRHFDRTSDRFSIKAALRARVAFSQANLLDSDFPVGRELYGVIFCRNLLIYLDLEARQRALAVLSRCLAPLGLLFVGSAEQPIAVANGFVSADRLLSSVCRKAGQTSHNPQCARAFDRMSLPELFDARYEPKQPLAGGGLSPAVSSGLEQVRRLADAGRLAEAATICEAHLHHNRGSAHAYYLLGLVRDAGGDPRSEECYRKALYLQPNHCDALLQMALLTEKGGDLEAALAFKRRAERMRVET